MTYITDEARKYPDAAVGWCGQKNQEKFFDYVTQNLHIITDFLSLLTFCLPVLSIMVRGFEVV